jgi:hypothetical protein
MKESEIKVLANLGDVHPLDYGGHIVYQIKEPNGRIIFQSEFWEEPLKLQTKPSYHKSVEPEDVYTVYRWEIEPDAVKDLRWAKLESVADFMGANIEEFKASGRSKDPVERAHFYEAIGRHSGFENLDGYPMHLTRKEMEKRWPQFA